MRMEAHVLPIPAHVLKVTQDVCASKVCNSCHKDTVVNPPVYCGIQCENGGTCSSNSCTCAEGYTGRLCEQSLPLSELERLVVRACVDQSGMRV